MYQFELNGIIGQPPDGWQDLIAEISFENDNPNSVLNSTEFTFIGERAIEINQFIEDFGVFTGMTYKVYRICDGVQTLYLDSVLDFASDSAKFSCDEVTVPVKEINTIQNVIDKIDGFGMAYLHKGLFTGQAGKIERSDFAPIYYSKSSIPNGVEVVTIGLTLLMMTKELQEQVQELGKAVTKLTKSITPTVVAGTGVSTGVNYGQIFSNAGEVVLRVAYLAVVVKAYIEFFKLLIDNLFPIPRVHFGMKVLTMFEKGCEFLGLTFKSSIFLTAEYSNLAIIPAKNEVGTTVTFQNQSDEIGYTNTETFGDFVREMILVFNAKFKVINGEFIFERRDFFKQPSGYKVPPIELRYNTTNASEINSNYYMTYKFDTLDKHTMRGVVGYSFQNVVSVIGSLPSEANLLKGLERKDFDFALARRKDSTTALEKILGTFSNSVLNFLSVFDAGSSFVPLIPNLIGNWEIETDFTDKKRLTVLSNTTGLIDSNSQSFLHVNTLWSNFHSIESPVPSPQNPIGNQYKLFKDLTIDLCCEDYIVLKDNNIGETNGGKEVIFESIKHNDFNGTAVVDIKLNETIAPNLQQFQIIDGK